jgi:hypothetical protein
MVDYEDAGPRMLAITLTATTFALLTLITRLYVRIKMIRNVGWDVRIEFLMRNRASADISPGLSHDRSHDSSMQCFTFASECR